MVRSMVSGALVCFVLFSGGMGWAGWQDFMQKVAGTPVRTTPSGSLPEAEIAAGLRQALDQGIRTAVSSLGRQGGFLDNPRVRIPMPEQFQSVEKVVRAVGRGDLADEFVLSMNRAAEQAVPATLEILSRAVSQMTLSDARTILGGPPDAATRFFERTSRTELVERIRPIISQATDSVGVTASSKRLLRSASPVSSVLGGQPAVDIDGYVTDKTLDGLFLLMADEERRIRENPAARTTDLLRKVFAGK
jgi:hypothetical protein